MRGAPSPVRVETCLIVYMVCITIAGHVSPTSGALSADDSRGQTGDETPLEDEEQQQGRQDRDGHAGEREALVGGIERREAGQRELDRERVRLLDQHERAG